VPLVRSGGVGINYECVGWDDSDDGRVPVLLHTGAGGDLRMWRLAGYVDGLSPRPLLLMDHRGHGSSDRPRNHTAHDMDRYVDDVLAVLNHAGAKRVVFVGYSDGASVGFAFASAHPARVAALIGLGALGGEDASQAERRSQAAAFRAEGLEALVDALADEDPDPVPGWFADQMQGTEPEMFALELEGWADWAGPWSTLPAIAAPTLLIVGELEDTEPGLGGQRAREMAARVRHGSAIELPATGHVGVFTRSDLTLPAIRSFLDALGPKAAGLS
jgi:pimeloyl-ACP methyl ester carboxylesterase